VFLAGSPVASVTTDFENATRHGTNPTIGAFENGTDASGPAFVQWIRTPAERRDAQVIAQSVAATEPLFALLDAHLQRHAFIAGEALTMADIPIACEVHRWWGLPQARPWWSHLERWYARWLALPASRGVLDLPLA
jgi:glutathione S-transferase